MDEEQRRLRFQVANAMRLDGLTYAAIGKRLGVSMSFARRLVLRGAEMARLKRLQDELAARRKRADDELEQMRRESKVVRRLDYFWPVTVPAQNVTFTEQRATELRCLQELDEMTLRVLNGP